MSAEGLLGKVLKTFLGSKKDRDIKELSPIIEKVAAVYPQLSSLSNDELRAKTTYFKEKIKEKTSTLENQIEELKQKIEAEASLSISEKEKFMLKLMN